MKNLERSARGFAEEREETVVGGHCFGAPVRDLNGEVIAAISVSLPVGR
jgi:DNA-binding IclR family transcriptional regulator